MNTRDMAAEYRMVHWAQIMQERQESKQNVKNYCEQNGIRENTYYYWQKKLREAALQEIGTLPVEQSSLKTQGFAEVNICESENTTKRALPASSREIEVYGCGVRISASEEYPAEKLALLIRELVKPC